MPKINQVKLTNYHAVEDPDNLQFYGFEIEEDREKPFSVFKLHLNLSDISFSRHHEEIADYLDKISPSRIFSRFKYSKDTADEIYNGEVYQSFLLLKQMCLLLKEDKITNEEVEIKSKAIALPVARERAIEIANLKDAGELNKKYIDETLKYIELELQAEERFCGQIQFTLYLLENINASKLSFVCALLDRFLHKIAAQQGTLDPSDLPVTSFISFRQDRVNAKDDYVYVVGLSKEKKDVFSKGAKDSTLYNQLVHETKAHGEVLAVIDDEIKTSTPTIIGLITAKLTDRTSPIQHSMNNAIKNLGRINNMHDFLEFKSDNVPSLKEVLSKPNAAAKHQTPWQKIEEIFKKYHLNASPALPPRPG